MSWYYQSGEGLNLLARAAAVRTPGAAGGTIDPNYPLANLYNGRPSTYMRYSTPAANEYVIFDLNLLQGGDAEVALDASWVTYSDTGTPTIAQDSTAPYAGTYSHRIQLVVGAGDHYAGTTRQVKFRAGEKLRIYHSGKVTTGTSVMVIVQNNETGKYLTSAGAWQTAAAQVGLHTTGAWTDSYATFTMPTVEEGGGLWQTLRVYFQGNVTAGTTIDVRAEAKIVPGWDTVVLLGHTNTPVLPVRLGYAALSGDDPRDAYAGEAYVSDWVKTTGGADQVFAADEYDLSALWNKAATTRYERWIAVYLNAAATYGATSAVGELILCQAETLARTPRLQVSDSYEATGQIRQESGAGDPWTYNRTPVPRHKITLRYQTADSPEMPGPSADERAIRRMFSGRTHGGLWPVLVIPYGSHDSRAVIYGQTQSVFAVEHAPPERGMEVEVLEYPIPGLQPGLFSV
jgi:hypothetical protein